MVVGIQCLGCSGSSNLKGGLQESALRTICLQRCIKKTPWLNQTGWLQHLKGRNSRILSNATSLPGASEKNLQTLYSIAKILVFALNKKASSESCPPILRMILNSSRVDEIADEALIFGVLPATLNSYALELQHMLCYLVRATRSPEPAQQHGVLRSVKKAEGRSGG